MTGKWALVTGSSHGLGLEIAIKLAEFGFQTVITGRNQESLTLAIKKLNSLSKAVHFSVCMDLTAEGAPETLFARLKEIGISLSVIINNLGGSVPGDRRNVPTDILRSSLRLNLEIGVEINNLFYEDLKANHGVIVHIGSTASLHFDAPPGYVISKSAVNAYVKNAARTFAKENVCIFAILPGILEHEGSYISRLSTSNSAQYGKALSESVFGRFTSSEETARFIVKTIEAFTPMLNGALIQFDGGKE
jgi:NAD(P)-dependent dehydrogenase (short-subunit alcohol dehydrogenase family)